LNGHKRQIEEQMADLQANLEEIKAHEREARALLGKAEKRQAA
jgi:transposase